MFIVYAKEVGARHYKDYDEIENAMEQYKGVENVQMSIMVGTEIKPMIMFSGTYVGFKQYIENCKNKKSVGQVKFL